MKNAETLEELIETFCQSWSRSNQRPDMGDVTIRKMFASELAGTIRKVANVTKKDKGGSRVGRD
jgi:hypothetical protein